MSLSHMNDEVVKDNDDVVVMPSSSSQINDVDDEEDTGLIQDEEMFMAAEDGDLAAVRRFIEVNGVTVNKKDKNGCSFLHWASVSGNNSLVHYLLSKGIDVNAGGGRNEANALYWAVRDDQIETIRILLSAGANPLQRTLDGSNAFVKAIHEGNSTVARIMNPLPQGSPLSVLCKTPKMFFTNGFVICRIRQIILFLSPGIAVSTLGLWLQYAPGLFLGTFGFLLLFAVLLFFMRILWIPNKIYNPAFASAFWTFGGLFSFTAVFLMPNFVGTMSFWIMQIAGYISCALYYKVYSDPGFIEPVTSMSYAEATADLTVAERTRWCRTCNIRKPIRSKHCPNCKHCVARMDHHCVYMHRCIGANNQRPFVFMLSLYLTVCVLFTYFTVVEVSLTCPSLNDSMKLSRFVRVHYWISCSPWLSWMITWSVLSTLFLGIILHWQIYMILTAITTNEVVNSSRYIYLKDYTSCTYADMTWGHLFSNKTGNPYDRGVIRNVIDFLGLPIGNIRPRYIDYFNTYVTPGFEPSVSDLAREQLDSVKVIAATSSPSPTESEAALYEKKAGSVSAPLPPSQEQHHHVGSCSHAHDHENARVQHSSDKVSEQMQHSPGKELVRQQAMFNQMSPEQRQMVLKKQMEAMSHMSQQQREEVAKRQMQMMRQMTPQQQADIVRQQEAMLNNMPAEQRAELSRRQANAFMSMPHEQRLLAAKKQAEMMLQLPEQQRRDLIERQAPILAELPEEVRNVFLAERRAVNIHDI